MAARPYLVDYPSDVDCLPTDRVVLAFARRVIEAEEGFRAEAYQDRGGVWTVGYGRTGPDVTADTTTTRAAEEVWLEARLREEAAAFPPVRLPAVCWAALISWRYNVGAAAADRSTLMRRLRDGRLDLVDDELARWIYSRGRDGRRSRDPVLVARRRAEAALWNLGLDLLARRQVAEAPAGFDRRPGSIEPEPVDVLTTGTGRTALKVGSLGSAGVLLTEIADRISEHRTLVAAVVALAILAVVAWLLWRRRAG